MLFVMVVPLYPGILAPTFDTVMSDIANASMNVDCLCLQPQNACRKYILTVSVLAADAILLLLILCVH